MLIPVFLQCVFFHSIFWHGTAHTLVCLRGCVFCTERSLAHFFRTCLCDFPLGFYDFYVFYMYFIRIYSIHGDTRQTYTKRINIKIVGEKTLYFSIHYEYACVLSAISCVTFFLVRTAEMGKVKQVRKGKLNRQYKVLQLGNTVEHSIPNVHQCMAFYLIFYVFFFDSFFVCCVYHPTIARFNSIYKNTCTTIASYDDYPFNFFCTALCSCVLE